MMDLAKMTNDIKEKAQTYDLDDIRNDIDQKEQNTI